MTYNQTRQTPEAKEWTIRKVNNAYLPVHNGNALPNNFAKKTVDAARIFIASHIAGNRRYEEIQNDYSRIYDYDLC